MDGNTLFILINIAIIGIIAITIVKIYYKDEDYGYKHLEKENSGILKNKSIKGFLSSRKNIFSKGSNKTSNNSAIRKNEAYNNVSGYFNNQQLDKDDSVIYDDHFITPEKEETPSSNINDEDDIKMFQEPIKDEHRDIMNQNEENNKKEIGEELNLNKVIEDETPKNDKNLKDLFTIDELIKESKQKDDEREKNKLDSEIKNTEDNDITNVLKESNESIETPEPDIIEPKIDESENKEEITEKPSIYKEFVDKDHANGKLFEENQKLIEENDRKNKKYSNEGVSLLPAEEKEDYKFGASIEKSELFKAEDLDYRKDIEKFTNTIKNSNIVKEVRTMLKPDDSETLNSDYLRSIKTYEAPEETDYDMQIRQENTKKVFNMAKTNKRPTKKIIPPQEVSSIPITINNNEVILKKGDEIIFKHSGETYSSQVFGIRGDEIQVRYRRKDIIIHPKDIKKVY